MPYKDSLGYLTIGVGRNLDHVGITQAEAMMMLERDIAVAETELRKTWPTLFQTEHLDEARRDAMVNLCFNMGISRLSGFKKLIAALEAREWDTAAKEAKDSRWATQVQPERVHDITYMLREGKYPKDAT
jgi:lysozyme